MSGESYAAPYNPAYLVQPQAMPTSLSFLNTPPQVDPMAYAAPAAGMENGLTYPGFGGSGAGFADGTTPPVTNPGGGFKGWFSNANNLGTVIQGIGALTQAYLGFKQLSLVKENFKLQKEAYRTNIRNSTQSYNTSLEDRIRGRTSNYDGKESDVQTYLAQNSLHP